MEEERREIRIVILLLSNSGASTGKERHVTIPVTFTSRKQYKNAGTPLSFGGKGSDLFVCLIW